MSERLSVTQTGHWKVWGDSMDPLLTGSEAEVKERAEHLIKQGHDDIYIEGYDGTEYEYLAGNWTAV
jgi:hypothetical protein